MAKQRRIVKINEDQYEYLKGGDVKNYNGNSEVSVPGKLNTGEDGIPRTTDEIGNMVTAQGYNRWPRRRISESDQPDNGDMNRDGVDDFYDDKQMDTLSNNNPNDNLTVVPNSIEVKVEALMNVIKSANLNALQTAAVLNEIIESMDLSKLPYKLKKDLRLKIQ